MCHPDVIPRWLEGLQIITMSPHFARSITAVLLTGVIGACSTDKKPAADTTTVLPAAANQPAVTSVNTGWQDTISGPALVLPVTDNSAAVSIVLPMMNDSMLSRDSTVSGDSLLGTTVDLFDRSGPAGVAQLSSRGQSAPAEGCLAWPVLSLRDPITKAWQVGFKAGIAASIPLDSLEGAASADSVLITTELARLASALPASNDPAFQGLPFSVRKAYRTKQNILIGDIVRKINEEANPREEHLLLIAEPNPTDRAHYVTVFHSRAAGSEEAVRTSDVLAAIQFVRNKRTALVVSFGYENGNRAVLIERMSNNNWKVTWRSAYTGC
jgi:hypothetical protein